MTTTTHDTALHKPRLRGWIHAVMAPLAVVATLVLMVFAPSVGTRAACAVYAFTGILLFTVSAIYHRGTWTPRTRMLLKRLDHTNIMLIIAGSYTPLAWVLLDRRDATILLTAVWIGALLGVVFRLVWISAPRWLYTPVYVALGLAALFYLPQFFAASVVCSVLILAGGALYIAGAVFYAMKRPNISMAWFGFHELFHAFTVGGFVCHFIAIMIAVITRG
ncbi:PAQR family membrane homeostasis protein TrhA [Falsarthrobacter nasiphocae]|uniref:Hemolysin III n=1 Tax=Falsarthrobacter nasiphocae TaxID=189863 RepID=A0AAE3YEC0_9MICC|nr:hemolysin III family protein [Falsarthrobacter nasiphocae]MDR6891645.1 hemolysin III [Falsarthrobacter nasiphocae]